MVLYKYLINIKALLDIDLCITTSKLKTNLAPPLSSQYFFISNSYNISRIKTHIKYYFILACQLLKFHLISFVLADCIYRELLVLLFVSICWSSWVWSKRKNKSRRKLIRKSLYCWIRKQYAVFVRPDKLYIAVFWGH